MITHQDFLISVGNFAHKTNSTAQKMLRDLKAGSKLGRRIKGARHMGETGLSPETDEFDRHSRVTAIMLAAANMHWQKFLRSIRKGTARLSRQGRRNLVLISNKSKLKPNALRNAPAGSIS